MDRQETLDEIMRLSKLAVAQMKESGTKSSDARQDTPTTPPSFQSRIMHKATGIGEAFNLLFPHGLLSVDLETLSIIRLTFSESTDGNYVIVTATTEPGLTVQRSSDLDLTALEDNDAVTRT